MGANVVEIVEIIVKGVVFITLLIVLYKLLSGE